MSLFICRYVSDTPTSTLLISRYNWRKKYNGVEIDKKKMEITYDTSIESEVGKLLDKYMLKSQDNE